MTDKVNPSVHRPVNAWETAGAIAYGGHAKRGETEGFITDSNSTTQLSIQDEDIDETNFGTFGESHSGSNLDVTISGGEAFIFGSWLAIDTETTVSLDASTPNQTVYVGWDKDGTNDAVVGLSDAFAQADDDTDKKIPLWEFDTDGSGVTSVTDRREIGPKEIVTDVADDGTITVEAENGPTALTIAPDGSIESLSLSASSLETLGDITDDNANTIYDYSSQEVPTDILGQLFAADIADVSPDSVSNAHHSKTGSGEIVHDDTVGGTDDAAHHTKTDSASELTDVSADSDSDAHHTRYADSEARTAVDGADVDILGDADTLDTYHASYFATDPHGNDQHTEDYLTDVDTGAPDPHGNTYHDPNFLKKTNYTPEVDTHDKTSTASELTDVSADSDSDAHHTRYTDTEAQDAIDNTKRVLTELRVLDELSGSGISIAGRANPDALYKFYEDGSGTIRHAENWYDGSSYHLLKTVADGIELDGSLIFRETDYTPEIDTHDKTDSASELTDVSADSVSDAHHEVFEPSDYTPQADTSYSEYNSWTVSTDGTTDDILSGHTLSLSAGSGISTSLSDTGTNTPEIQIENTASSFSGSHDDLSNVDSSDHHSKTSSASELTDVSADSVSDAHHSPYEDEYAQDAVGDILDYHFTYDDIDNEIRFNEFNVSHDNISNVSNDDHHEQTSITFEETSTTTSVDITNGGLVSIADGENIGLVTAPGADNNSIAYSFSVDSTLDNIIGINVANAGSNPNVLDIDDTISVDGDVDATGAKNFVIDHPDGSDRKLRHTAYEGSATGGLLYRDTVTATDGEGDVSVPEYVKDGSLGRNWSAQVTPTDHFGRAYVDTETWTLHADTDGDYNVLITGERTDLPDHYDIDTRKTDETWDEAYERKS